MSVILDFWLIQKHTYFVKDHQRNTTAMISVKCFFLSLPCGGGLLGVSFSIETPFYLKLSGNSSREDVCRLQTYFRYQQYSKFCQARSGHAADSKLGYRIQFSILMLCAKYQEAGLCGSWEKCDRYYFVTQTPDSDPCVTSV